MSQLVAIADLSEQSATQGRIFEIAAAREVRLSRMLVAYIVTGLLFMLLPGTFLGVWNLITISSHHAAGTASAAWIQAHGHAQIFGWIGTFIFGVGYYSIPKLRKAKPFALWAPWTSWTLWTLGVTLRWMLGIYEWQWRALLPVSAILEMAAFAIFFKSVGGHRPGNESQAKLDKWILVVIVGCIGWMSALVINLFAAVFLSIRGVSPVLPHSFDQRLLVLETWGFLVPFVWGFSARWLPVFLGLRKTHNSLLLPAVALNSAGVLAALFDWMVASTLLLSAGVSLAIYAIRVFEPSERPPKITGVHTSFASFVRIGYGWAGVAALLGIWASTTAVAPGIWGASRHALTVGFFAVMVFSIGQRILPAFSGMKLLFSTRLMFWGLVLLTAGCFLRVVAQIISYQGMAAGAWAWLPVSAITEMTAVSFCCQSPDYFREIASAVGVRQL
jgi:uncharacterized protein involved in response to NO